MKNETQLERYKKLLNYIDKKFKEDINIDTVEEVCHYSYRNINRIFQALHHQTIGKYVKRLRLEKAAEYLKYSKLTVSDIAFDVGFSDVAAFSKAFKSKFNCSPSAFRESNQLIQAITRQTLLSKQEGNPPKLAFTIEFLPAFEMLYLEHRGAYDNIKAIKETWEQFYEYVFTKNLLSDDTVFLAEILDDNEISENINCRYNVGIILAKPLPFTLDGLFQTQSHQAQKYVKFLHKGTHESSFDTYNRIYAAWMSDVQLEFEDLSTLEFFLNDESDTPAEDLLTEIYIPVK